MLPSVHVLFHPFMHLVASYGLVGLFFSSLLVSTIFIPFSVEFLIPPLLVAGVNPYHVLIASVLGSTIGVWINYLVGYYGIHAVKKYVKEEDIQKAKKVMDKYGWLGLFFIVGFPVPIPTDPVTVLCGMSEMNPVEFTLAVLFGKILKYGAFIGVIKIFL
jgi:membrane protein YqaA with SNARE-associated domain